ncbi:hypothetical protein Nepgr_031904 [Nepenthes gracilis]|uniref:Uncharacterized protein n=1 Tax=Nepenthes gracilis TaxID=150966 RepID=A0AAD3Y7W6_NEPGR|nr:hypothetical protein Nepgr_031904 [Nepenthes gracilis]
MKNKRKFEEMGNRESHSIFHDVVQAKSKSRTNVVNEAMERREKKKKMKVGLGATREVKELMNDCDAHSISHGESIQCNGNERKKHESIRNRVEDKEQRVM